jgi:hypothetical protein
MMMDGDECAGITAGLQEDEMWIAHQRATGNQHVEYG